MQIEKLPIFLVNTLLLIWFHKPSFTPYPSPSGQVGISSIPSKNAGRKITDLSGKHSFTLLFSYTRCMLSGGTFFLKLCCCVSFWLWWEIVLGFTYLPYQLCRCVFFMVVAGNSFGLHRSIFWLWREIVLGVTYLPTIPVVPLCQFFGCGKK
jgi:hypothetical protein